MNWRRLSQNKGAMMKNQKLVMGNVVVVPRTAI
jgi:hypothetical protein